MSYKNEINDFYSSYQTMFGFVNINNPLLVGWSNVSEQYNRFKTLLDIGVVNGDSILDYGCGLGHMVNYLKDNDISVNYTGIDINSKYIKIAEKLNEDYTFFNSDITELTDKNFDWVLGSGVFTYGMSYDEVIERINVAMNLSNKGVAFNFLDEDHEGKIVFKVYNDEKLINELKLLYNNVELVDGYCDNDFTIYIKK